MMADHGDTKVADGGPVRHIPVMLREVLATLDLQKGETIIDGTFGAGGYSAALLETGADVLAIDRDPDAIVAGQDMVEHAGGHLKLVEASFSALDKVAEEHCGGKVDGVVLDVGVSSMQIDEAARGFSFQKQGPLDMRMAQSGLSAADVVNNFQSGDLTRIIGILGEERKAGRIARAIVKSRDIAPIKTTLELAKIVVGVLGQRMQDKIHPATRTFQALRIFVNQELEELAQALVAAERVLKPGGRLVVVSFHSLEDRLVKRFLLNRATQPSGSRHAPQMQSQPLTFELIKKGTVKASPEECEINPRARSAKLRAARRSDASPRDGDLSFLGLPNFSSIAALDKDQRLKR